MHEIAGLLDDISMCVLPSDIQEVVENNDQPMANGTVEKPQLELKTDEGTCWEPGESSTDDDDKAPIMYTVEENEQLTDTKEDDFSTFQYWHRTMTTNVDVAQVTDRSITSPTDDPDFQQFMNRRFSDYDSTTSPIEGSPKTNGVVDTSPKETIGQKCRRSWSESESSDDVPLMFNVKPSDSFEADDNLEQDDEFESQDIVPQPLLDNFVSMVEPVRAQQIETDISRYCAYNLPAVAFTLGRRYWPQIKPTYDILANDMQWKVRRTLAFSIHELAAILGDELTVNDLLPVFQAFLRDLDEVRIGVLKHLYDFIKLLNKEVRKTLLPNLTDFMQTDNTKNWRFRFEFTKQCKLLCELYDIEDINQYIAAIALTLATDKIADIRREAACLLGTVLLHFYKTENGRGHKMLDTTNSFIRDIVNGFSKSQRWLRRQTFAYFCEQVIVLRSINEELFTAELMEPLMALVADKIPNVRLACVRVFASSEGFFSLSNLAQVDQTLKHLSNDIDRDCRQVARLALGYETNDDQSESNCEHSIVKNGQEHSSEC